MLLPDSDALVTQFWLVIILFLYSIFNRMEFDKGGGARRRQKYVAALYERLSHRYGASIERITLGDTGVDLAIYSIMIYENFNRPPIVRLIEQLTPSSWAKTTGIMQVASRRALSDADSVDAGVRQIVDLYEKARKKVAEQGGAPVAWGFNADRDEFFEAVAGYNRDDDYMRGVLEIKTFLQRSIKRFEPDYFHVRNARKQKATA